VIYYPFAAYSIVKAWGSSFFIYIRLFLLALDALFFLLFSPFSNFFNVWPFLQLNWWFARTENEHCTTTVHVQRTCYVQALRTILHYSMQMQIANSLPARRFVSTYIFILIYVFHYMQIYGNNHYAMYMYYNRLSQFSLFFFRSQILPHLMILPLIRK
jgi:hypothetical protein